MNNTNTYDISTKLQKTLKKLISEEWIAYQLYLYSRLAVKRDELTAIDELFKEIGNDELNDHMKNLIEWCIKYEINVPCNVKEFEKYADPRVVKQLNTLKKHKGARYYIDEGIKSEQYALESYRNALELDEVSQYPELQSELWHIFYDEAEHQQMLYTAQYAVDACVNMIIQ